MRITKIETFLVDCYRTNWVFVKVITDEGIVGVGEATLEGRELTVAEAIGELGRYLIGQDPFAIEKHSMRMQRDCYWRTGPILSTAISGVEMALWDIKGKALGVPVYELLGGLVNARIKVYANGWFAGARTAEEFAEKAAATVALGFRALKWDPFGTAYLNLSTREMDAALKKVAAVREAVGPSVDLLIEAHGRFDVMTACRIGRELGPFRPYWYEEPIPPGSPQALAEVRRAVPVPIAAGERCYSRFDCAELLRNDAVDVIQPDVCHVGGLLEMKRVASMADAFYVPVSPHSPNGPVCHAATLHFAASCHGFLMLETMVTDVSWRGEVASEYGRFVDGCFEPPSQPGLGVELHEGAFSRFSYSPKDLRHYDGSLTNIRPPDARRWF
ncbi:MAG: galactonate dehydratase [Limnochordia bacterium]|jgi:galactonate dehydratase